ncbi:MAG: DUF4387 domain-containing protein [bacterium]|nr:DUF4387 domain-containing protein [bacterium]
MKEYFLTDLCEVIRSKQAGPFRLTFDLLFKNSKVYESVRDNKVLQPEKIAAMFNIAPDKITNFVYYDPASAVKITFIRPCVAGSPGDSDVYACQQHAPFLKMKIQLPEEVL